jgi:hypothetical protein
MPRGQIDTDKVLESVLKVAIRSAGVAAAAALTANDLRARAADLTKRADEAIKAMTAAAERDVANRIAVERLGGAEALEKLDAEVAARRSAAEAKLAERKAARQAERAVQIEDSADTNETAE